MRLHRSLRLLTEWEVKSGSGMELNTVSSIPVSYTHLLPGAKAVFTVTPDSPRALDGESLAKEAQKYADNIWYVPDIGKAVKMAKETAKESDVILAVGSLSYLKEVKKALGQG